MASVLAAAALSGFAGGGIAESQTTTASAPSAKAKAEPAQQNKQTPRDSKTSRLAHRLGGWPKPGRGKRVSHTVAHGQRIARKARKVKRHRARS